MIRTVAMLAVIIGTAVVGYEFQQPGSVSDLQTDVDSLKQRRVQLLQDRVAAIQEWVDAGRTGTSELIRPEMDVINATLEYENSNVKRKELLDELLAKYDILIEHSALISAEPVRTPPGSLNQQMLAESKLLYLKSERVRIQILRNSID